MNLIKLKFYSICQPLLSLCQEFSVLIYVQTFFQTFLPGVTRGQSENYLFEIKLPKL